MIKFYRKTFLLILCTFFSLASYGQQPQIEKSSAISPFYKTLLYAGKSSSDTIHLAGEVTSLSLSIDFGDDFESSILINGKDTFKIQEDLHEPEGITGRFSQLIIFEAPVKSFVFRRGNIKGDVVFHLINSGKTPAIDSKSKRLKQGCGELNTIDQSEWRAGLPSPDYVPSYSKVNHIIVHHAAGSNTNTDFTNVVRQIYLYHTEVRNYSDVGYNFLIAQDGSIYQGREGAGDNEEDVIGAHFCAKNTNTMGICLLGNYDTANPPAVMLSALENLMAWKLSKENLNPLGVNSHPVGSANASSLGIISGHRDGCATQCPGNNVYALLNQIKANTEAAMKNTDSGLPAPQIVAHERQGAGSVTIEVTGGMEGAYLWFTSENLKDSIPGARSSKFTTPDLSETTSYYVAIRSGNCVGPLLKVDAVIKDDRFLVYPNPTDGVVTVTFNEAFKPYFITVLNSVGQKLDLLHLDIEEDKVSLDTSTLARGVYFLVFKSADKTLNKKLIVN